MQPMGRFNTQTIQLFFCGCMEEGTGGGEKDFFVLFPSSQCIPIMFPWGSHQVPKDVSQDVPNNTFVLSHMVCAKLSPCQLYKWAQRASHYILTYKVLFWVNFQSLSLGFPFLEMDQ